MRLREFSLSAAMVAMLFGSTACSKLFGGLRPDLDDSQQAQPDYTSGGQWPEHGFLSDDMAEGGSADGYNSVGHSERGPASTGGNSPYSSSSGSSWVSPDQAAANRRDSYRGADGSPSFSSDPNLGPPTKRLYKNGARATKDDFVDSSQNEGSLWASDGQTNYYFTKNKIRGVGDIVSVKLDSGLIKDLGAEIKRTLTPDEKDAELQAAGDRAKMQAAGGAQAQAQPQAPGAPQPGPADQGLGAAGPAPASVNQPDLPAPTDKDIDVTKSIDVKDGDVVMAEIVGRYPNGNYKLQGTKKIIYKNGAPRLLTLVGIAKGTDIGDDDTVNSGKLYEYHLEAIR